MITTIEAPFTLCVEDKKHIEEKIADLTTFESRMTQVNVFFKADDDVKDNAILAEILVRVPGKDIFAEKSNSDAMVAFADTYETIKRQLTKRRDQINDHYSEVKAINDIA